MGSEGSKEKFKEYFHLFLEKKIDPKRHEFWHFLFTTTLARNDIYEMIKAEDIRRMRNEQPSNLAQLILKCLEQVILYSSEEKFSDEQLSIRNSIIYLTRVMPLLLEHDEDYFLQCFFEENTVPTKKLLKELKGKRGVADLIASEKLRDEDEEEEEPALVEKKVVVERLPDSELKEEKPEEKPEEEEGEKEKPKEVKEVKEVKEEEEEVKKEEVIEKKEEVEEKKEEVEKKEKVDVKEKGEEEEGEGEIEQPKPVKQQQQPAPTPGSTSTSVDGIRSKIHLGGGVLNNILVVGNEKLRVRLFQKMMFVLCGSLFLPKYTIPLTQIKQKFKKLEGYPPGLDRNLLWEGGCAVPRGSFYPSVGTLENRKNLLRCLIHCCSATLYRPPYESTKGPNVFMDTLVSNDTPYSANLFYSCLNVVLQYDPSGSLPYTTVIFNDNKEEITLICLQFLILVLNYERQGRKNVFIEYLHAMEKPSDFKVIFASMTRLLRNRVDADNTYLPSSQKPIVCTEELVVLLWKLLEHNHRFRFHVCKSENVNLLFASLVYIFQKNCKSLQQYPFLQVIAFVILLLSEERLFGVALNRPFIEKLPKVKLPLFTGSYFDFMVIMFHKFITEDRERIVRPLLNCMLTIIQNVTPYCKALSVPASVNLIHLFELLSKPHFMYGNETNHELTHLLLNSLNNLIQYQYEGNVNVVYSILRKKEKFLELSKPPNLPKIVEELHKRKIKFLPRDPWISSWKKKLPIYTILSLLRYLVPEIEEMCKDGSVTEEEVLNHLKQTTLVGVLPVPHTIIIRTFKSNARIQTFLTTFIWGLIYVKNLHYLPWDSVQFDADRIKLFTVKSSEK